MLVGFTCMSGRLCALLHQVGGSCPATPLPAMLSVCREGIARAAPQLSGSDLREGVDSYSILESLMSQV